MLLANFFAMGFTDTPAPSERLWYQIGVYRPYWTAIFFATLLQIAHARFGDNSCLQSHKTGNPRVYKAILGTG